MKPSEEIRRIVERWMQAISERDSESSLERVSDLPGALMIGTDPEEWFHGAEARAIWVAAGCVLTHGSDEGRGPAERRIDRDFGRFLASNQLQDRGIVNT